MWRVLLIGAVCFLLGNGFAHAQKDIDGYWFARVKTTNGIFQILLQISKKEGGYTIHYRTSLFDNKILRADSVRFTKQVLMFTSNKYGELFRAMRFNDSLFKGRIKVDKFYPVELRKTAKPPSLAKQQTPQPPYPYSSELISFINKTSNLRISGVLSYPDETSIKHPAILLLSGSEKDNYDYSYGSHKPFAVLADYFTRLGYVVLRTNDRGVGGSKGIYENTTLPDLVDDAGAALHYLLQQKHVDTARVGLIGHSEGGMVAAALALEEAKRIRFVVSLAAPIVPMKDLFVQQVKDIVGQTALVETETFKKKVADFYFNAIALKEKFPDSSAYKQEVFKNFKQTFPTINQEIITATLNRFVTKMNANRYEYLKNYDPGEVLQKLNCPVLGLFGTKDLLVNGPINSAALRNVLQNRQDNSKTKLFSGLNHNFQHCKNCDFEEPLFLEETFSIAVMQEIAQWLLKIDTI